MDAPWSGEWPFELSRQVCKVRSGHENQRKAEGRRSDAGRIECRRHVVLVIRGATRLACCLQNVDNPSCTWVLRATHSSDESRFPCEKRRSAVTTARRIVRGNPVNSKSIYWWPGCKAEQRPTADIPSEDPMAEPSDAAPDKVVIRKSLPERASPFDSSAEFHAPPASVRDFFRGESVAIPKFPLCVLGLAPAEVRKLQGRADADAWWDVPFHMGRVPFDSKYCAVWRALFESFAPIERVLAPAFRALLRAHNARLRCCATTEPGSA